LPRTSIFQQRPSTDSSHVGTHHLAQSCQPPFSPAEESTPPPSPHAPSLNLPYKSETLAPDSTGYCDRTPNESTSSRKSRPGIQTIKAPVGSRPRPPVDSRHRSVNPSYIIHVSRSSHNPQPQQHPNLAPLHQASLSLKVFVTTDSEHYTAVDISDARSAPQIRESISSKVHDYCIDTTYSSGQVTRDVLEGIENSSKP